ncbi:MAG: DNA-binding protein WhiA [Pygmaiobacter massiliensis]|uniref:DNA-binding protein WhiA n=1 Tax=Pygmaiobacter massiliensis TaxID=1917873 RepID=UPI00289C331F|nr:DNA-binding protein WhiA [Pygmaiobacter massiliensis]MDD3202814.1 DNA-binding protein WhiA [Pygmaiobacter massiliensis]
MSFSSEVKTELCKRTINKQCCVRAACYGFACFDKYFDDKGVVLHTERAMIAQHAKHLYKQLGIRSEVVEKLQQDGPIYEFSVKEPESVAMMLLSFGHTGKEKSPEIHRDIFICPSCLSAFLASAFLCCGMVADPVKEYSIEFVSNRVALLESFSALLQDYGFEPRIAKRRYNSALYFKASEQVEDMLTLMGATTASLEIMNRKIYKEFRNKTNRITNCENANIDKIINASENAIRNLQLLRENQQFESLPEELREIARLRIDYPECSLAELGAMLEPPLGKSGVSHRLRKLASIAEGLKKAEAANAK